jgi:hypothetical protein
MITSTANITQALSLSAIVISGISIFISWKNTQKQIRVNKIEEILYVLHLQSIVYYQIYQLINDLKKLNKDDVYELKDWNDRSSKLFLKIKNNENIAKDGLKKMKVLVNAYIPNKRRNCLKIKLLALAELFFTCFSVIENEDIRYLIKKYDTNELPKPEIVLKFINSLENKLIQEMNLGFKGVDFKLFNKYLNDKFFKELGIDNKENDN